MSTTTEHVDPPKHLDVPVLAATVDIDDLRGLLIQVASQQADQAVILARIEGQTVWLVQQVRDALTKLAAGPMGMLLNRGKKG